MNNIRIKDGNTNFLLWLNSSHLYGYKISNNEVKNIDNGVFKYLNLFKLSNNNTKLGYYGKYKVILDNDTLLKHYFYNNYEDIKMLFLNNGENSISYIGNLNLNSNEKIFRFKNIVIIASCISMILANNILNNNIDTESKTSSFMYELDDYDLNDIKNFIYSSTYLSDEEKDYLYNPDFLSDVLKVVNSSLFLKLQYQNYFNNIRIDSYIEDDINLENSLGYYNTNSPSTLYIKNYDCIDTKNMDTIAHEFVHLCQDTSGYNLIIEACAEIISYEYYPNTRNSCYTDQVILVKKLMEIIGPDLIWEYNFTGDFSKIEESIRPYLSNDEYNEFISDLTFEYNNTIVNNQKFESLDNILSILYKNIYGKDIEDDEVISNINNSTLVRYYFNSRMINQDNSYYFDNNLGSYETISLEDAMNNNIIFIYARKTTSLTNEEAFEIIKNGGSVYREIVNSYLDISIYGRLDKNGHTYISYISSGKRYTNIDLDDLVILGLVKVNYYLVDQKRLTADEYINHEYDDEAEIYILHQPDTVLNEDNTVYTFLPKKVYLPTIQDRFENTKIKV